MELQEFISGTLIQIARGIEDAAVKLKDSKAIVNPRNVAVASEEKSGVYGFVNAHKPYYKAVQKIEFDVAVTASQEKETKGGIGIMVSCITLGSQGRSEAVNSSVSRIKFCVPMVLPMENAPHDTNDPKG